MNLTDPDCSTSPRVIRPAGHPGGLRTLLRCLLALALLASFETSVHSRILITEVMASNQRTVLDEDRQPSDWIELLNLGAEPANLSGWCLTDDPNKLTKWKFPDTPVKPGEYTLVFASGKNRSQAGKELHTNFKLDVEGEFLALVQPDGKTVSQEFKPKLPPLRPDVSYGIPLTQETYRIVGPDAPKWVRVPAADTGESWKQPEASLGGWSMGKGGVGFDSTTNLLRWLGADVAPMMKQKSGSLQIRVPFVANALDFDRMVLRMYYDDGFVAWLNGREVARRNAPETLQWNSTATRSRDTASPVLWTELFDTVEPDFTLTNGDAAGRARVTASSPDTNRFLRLVNGRLPDQINGISFPQVLPVAARGLKLDFEYRIKGGNGSPTELMVAMLPTKDHETRGPGADLAIFRNGKDMEMRGGLVVRLSVSPAGRNSEVTVHWNGKIVHEARIADVSIGWRFYHRAFMQVDFSDQEARLSLKVMTDSRGGTGHEVAILSNLTVPSLQPYASRLQFVGHASSTLATVDLDNLRAVWMPSADSLSEDIDLTSFLGLMKPGTNVLAILGLNQTAEDSDFLILPELYGYSTRLQTNALRYFSPASPLTPNQDAGYGTVVPSPVITPAGSVFQGETRVSLSNPQAGAVIHYAVDGREPGESSPIYTQPLTLNTTTILKARAFAPGCLPSPAAMAVYTSVGKDLADFDSNLPLLVLNAQGNPHSDSRRAPLVASFLDNGKGRSTIRSTPVLESRADFNIRGFSSLRYPKRSYTLRLRDEYGEKFKTSVLGMPKESDWVLYAPFPDKTLMRDVVAYELFRRMGHYAPRTRFVELFLNRNGDQLSGRDYQGVYVVIEKIKRGKNRVPIEELGRGDNEGEALTGGYIFKRDHSNNESPTFRSRGGEFFLIEPDPEDATPQQKEYIEKHFREVERSIFGKNLTDPRKGYRNYLDVPSFIDQHWLIEMSKNIDGFRYSVIFSKDRGGKLKLEPPWDWNLSFGNANYLDAENPRGWYTDQLRDSEISWFRRLVEDPEFNQKQLDRWWELRKSVLSTESVLKLVDDTAAQLKEAQERNFRRWTILGSSVHPNSFVGDTYEEEVGWMKKWIRERLQWIDQQVPAPPTLSAKSDKGDPKLSMKGKGGSVYFTTDGTDPRNVGGQASGAAKLYETPLPWTRGMKVMARVKRSDGWSAPSSLDAGP